jgi:predicted Zn-dependent peptidase
LAAGELVVGRGRVLSPGALKRRFSAVTPAQVRAVAREFFRPERLNVAVVTPRKREGGVGAELARLGD